MRAEVMPPRIRRDVTGFLTEILLPIAAACAVEIALLVLFAKAVA